MHLTTSQFSNLIMHISTRLISHVLIHAYEGLKERKLVRAIYCTWAQKFGQESTLELVQALLQSASKYEMVKNKIYESINILQRAYWYSKTTVKHCIRPRFWLCCCECCSPCHRQGRNKKKEGFNSRSTHTPALHTAASFCLHIHVYVS